MDRGRSEIGWEIGGSNTLLQMCQPHERFALNHTPMMLVKSQFAMMIELRSDFDQIRCGGGN
jgi:hypothetical protein